MRVIRAEHAGACYGVRRALDLAEESLKSGKSVSSLGSLIHNPVVVSEFENQGLSVALTPRDVATQQVIIRSHGISPQIREELESINVEIIDATCPHVLRAQKAASDLARRYSHVLIIGDNDHPEVEGLKSHVERQGSFPCACTNANEISKDIEGKIGVVIQTTQTQDTVDAILSALQLRKIEYELIDTICLATQHRQSAARDLAQSVDAMVVLGGKNSANTVHLFEICIEECPLSYHIEMISDIDPQWFKGCETIGLCAGASTPESQLQEVEFYLRGLT